MLHLVYSKFIQIDAKDQQVPWMFHYTVTLDVPLYCYIK